MTWAVVPALLLIASGLFGPMLTGGVSSRLPSIAGPSQKSQRRAQSWDVASYGISGALGPAAVAWVAAGPGPLVATLVLAAAAILGAGAVLALPRQAPPSDTGAMPSPGRTLLAIWLSGPLRRTLGLTIVSWTALRMIGTGDLRERRDQGVDLVLLRPLRAGVRARPGRTGDHQYDLVRVRRIRDLNRCAVHCIQVPCLV